MSLRADHSSRGVLPTVMRRCMWSRNLMNEEAMAHWGLSRKIKKSGWCVGLTTLPHSCANCLEIWESQPSGTLRAWPDFYWECRTFTSTYVRHQWLLQTAKISVKLLFSSVIFEVRKRIALFTGTTQTSGPFALLIRAALRLWSFGGMMMKERLKYLDRNLSDYHFVSLESHMERNQVEAGPPRYPACM